MAKFEVLAWACSTWFLERFRSVKLQIDRLMVLMAGHPIALLSIGHSAWGNSRQACSTMLKFEELAGACSSSIFERFCSVKLQIDRLVLLMTGLPMALLSIWHSARGDSRKACSTMPKFEELAWACSSSFFERFCSVKLQIKCLVLLVTGLGTLHGATRKKQA